MPIKMLYTCLYITGIIHLYTVLTNGEVYTHTVTDRVTFLNTWYTDSLRCGHKKQSAGYFKQPLPHAIYLSSSFYGNKANQIIAKNHFISCFNLTLVLVI